MAASAAASSAVAVSASAGKMACPTLAADAQFAAGDRERAREGRRQAGGHVVDLGDLGVARIEQHRELVSAEPRHHVGRRARSRAAGDATALSS